MLAAEGAQVEVRVPRYLRHYLPTSYAFEVNDNLIMITIIIIIIIIIIKFESLLLSLSAEGAQVEVRVPRGLCHYLPISCVVQFFYNNNIQ